jgi:hypothetical protein
MKTIINSIKFIPFHGRNTRGKMGCKNILPRGSVREAKANEKGLSFQIIIFKKIIDFQMM